MSAKYTKIREGPGWAEWVGEPFHFSRFELGADLSHHNGKAGDHDLAEGKAQGLAFVGVKATEGLTFTSPQGEALVTAAKAAGLDTFVYHIQRFEDDAEGQGRRLGLAHVTWGASLLPALDLETKHVEAGVATYGGLDPITNRPLLPLAARQAGVVNQTLKAARRCRQEAGVLPLLYVSPRGLKALGPAASELRDLPLWWCDYEAHTPEQAAGALKRWRENGLGPLFGSAPPWRWLMWQWTSSADGRPFGVADDKIDLNFVPDLAALKAIRPV